ncbi:MAG: M16 family metallopeptidase [Planctomycetota bacterium]
MKRFLRATSIFLLLASSACSNKEGGFHGLTARHPSSLGKPDLAWAPAPLADFHQPNKGNIQWFRSVDTIVPLVVVTIRGQSGARHLGVPLEFAELATRCLSRGGHGAWGEAPARTSAKVQDWLDTHGASLQFSVGEDTWSISLDCHKDDLKEGLAMVSAMVSSSDRAIDDEFPAWKEGLVAGIQEKSETPAAMVKIQFNRLLYPGHRQGEFLDFQRASSLTCEGLKELSKKLFDPRNVQVLLQGDIHEDQEPAIETMVASWKPRQENEQAPGSLQPPAAPGLYIQDFKGKPDVRMMMGQRGVQIQPPQVSDDFMILGHVSRVLGVGFQSRLVREVRSNRSLTYSIHSNVGRSQWVPAPFAITHSGHRADRSAELLTVLLDELTQLNQLGITEEERLESADAAMSQLRADYGQRADTMAHYADLMLQKMDVKDFSQGGQRLSSIPLDLINARTKALINPSELVIVMVGDKSKILEKPKKGPGIVELCAARGIVVRDIDSPYK